MYKLPEVAQRLDVSLDTARRYVRSGEIPSVFIGGTYRITEEDLQAFVASRRSDAPKVQAPPSKEAGRRDAWADSYARLGERLAWEWGLEFDVRMEHRDFEWLMRVLEATKDYQKLMSGIPQTTRSLEGAESLVGFLDNALPKFKKAIDKTEDPGLQEHYESILKESGLLLSGKDA